MRLVAPPLIPAIGARALSAPAARVLRALLAGCLAAAVLGSGDLAAWVDALPDDTPPPAIAATLRAVAHRWDAALQPTGLPHIAATLRAMVRNWEAARFGD